MLLKIKKPITLISIIISLICFSLSVWQIKRLQWKKELINNIENAYNSESININTLSGDLNNLNGQAGGKRRRRSRKTRKNRMRGGSGGPVAFGYSTGGSELNSVAEANPPPINSYNSCQTADYIH